MSVLRDRLPEGLVEMSPGPDLAITLAGIEMSRLNGHDLVKVAPAYVRMISHLQAQLLQLLNQVEHCPPGDADSPAVRTEHPNQWASVEVAARLHWSAGKADYQLRYAHHIVARLSVVHASLAAGIIDLDQARAIVEGVLYLDDDAAQLIAAKVLAAGASSWTRRQLADRLRREVAAYDAAAAARRRRERQRERRVQAEPRPDGTVDLLGLNLPPDRVAAIVERLGAIARTAKRHGDDRTVDQLKADGFCDLLEGTGIGASQPGLVTNPGPTGHPDVQDSLVTVVEGRVASSSLECVGSNDSGNGPAPLPGPRRGVVHLIAPLSTVAGIADEPGELAGFGPVAADIVRQVVADRADARWRFSVFDDLTGQLISHGITQTRPRPAGAGLRTGFSAEDVAFIRARDRTCRGPTHCAVPATDCEIDHTLAKVDGGRHERNNGGPLCKRHHMYKHQSGARLEQLEPGVFRWTTSLGHVYEVRPQARFEDSTGPPETIGAAPSDAGRRLTRCLPTLV